MTDTTEPMVWVVTDGYRNLPGSWPTKAKATQEGYLSKYLLSGIDVIKVPLSEVTR